LRQEEQLELDARLVPAVSVMRFDAVSVILFDAVRSVCPLSSVADMPAPVDSASNALKLVERLDSPIGGDGVTVVSDALLTFGLVSAHDAATALLPHGSPALKWALVRDSNLVAVFLEDYSSAVPTLHLHSVGALAHPSAMPPLDASECPSALPLCTLPSIVDSGLAPSISDLLGALSVDCDTTASPREPSNLVACTPAAMLCDSLDARPFDAAASPREPSNLVACTPAAMLCDSLDAQSSVALVLGALTSNVPLTFDYYSSDSNTLRSDALDAHISVVLLGYSLYEFPSDVLACEPSTGSSLVSLDLGHFSGGFFLLLVLSYRLRRAELPYLLVNLLPQLLFVPFDKHHVLLDLSAFASYLDFV